MSEQSEEIITLTFENAATKQEFKIPAVSSELLRDYVGQAAKQLFKPVPTRVGLATKDGQIVQNWSDSSVSAVLERYKTNVFVIGSPDQLGTSIEIDIQQEEFNRANEQFEALLMVYSDGVDPEKSSGKEFYELDMLLTKVKKALAKTV